MLDFSFIGSLAIGRLAIHLFDTKAFIAMNSIDKLKEKFAVRKQIKALEAELRAANVRWFGQIRNPGIELLSFRPSSSEQIEKSFIAKRILLSAQLIDVQVIEGLTVGTFIEARVKSHAKESDAQYLTRLQNIKDTLSSCLTLQVGVNVLTGQHGACRWFNTHTEKFVGEFFSSTDEAYAWLNQSAVRDLTRIDE